MQTVVHHKLNWKLECNKETGNSINVRDVESEDTQADRQTQGTEDDEGRQTKEDKGLCTGPPVAEQVPGKIVKHVILMICKLI